MPLLQHGTPNVSMSRADQPSCSFQSFFPFKTPSKTVDSFAVGGPVAMGFSVVAPAALKSCAKTHTRHFSCRLKNAYRGLRVKNPGSRLYSVILSRWISRDPIEEGGGINSYGFLLNQPINRIDPDGRLCYDLVIAAGTAVNCTKAAADPIVCVAVCSSVALSKTYVIEKTAFTALTGPPCHTLKCPLQKVGTPAAATVASATVTFPITGCTCTCAVTPPPGKVITYNIFTTVPFGTCCPRHAPPPVKPPVSKP